MREQNVPSSVEECGGRRFVHPVRYVYVLPPGQCRSICMWLCGVYGLPPNAQSSLLTFWVLEPWAPNESRGKAHT